MDRARITRRATQAAFLAALTVLAGAKATEPTARFERPSEISVRFSKSGSRGSSIRTGDRATGVPATQVQNLPARQILVSIPDRKLALMEDGKVLRVFAVAVGAKVSPSPMGGFRIVHRLENPTYYHPGVVIPAGQNNPLGPRWLGLSQKGLGIHGTNDPRSIGKAASHGCIRLRNSDIRELFSMVRVGDAVEIRGVRDTETAQVFGPHPPDPLETRSTAGSGVVAVASATRATGTAGGQ